MKGPFGKFGRPTEQPREPVSSERAARLATADFDLMLKINELIVALEKNETQWEVYTDEQMNDQRVEIEQRLRAKGIVLEPNKDGSDPFVTFIKSFQDRHAKSARPPVPPTSH